MSSPPSNPIGPVVKARTLSRKASVTLVEDGRILIHMDGDQTNTARSNVLALFLNIGAESYLGMTPDEQAVWNKVNRDW